MSQNLIVRIAKYIKSCGLEAIFWPLALVYLFIAAFFSAAWLDETYYAYSSWVMVVDRLIPYKDFFTLYFPYIHYFFGLPQLIFGPNLFLTRLISAAILLIIIYIAFKFFGESKLKYFYGAFILLNLPHLSSYITVTPFALIVLINITAAYLVYKKRYLEQKFLILIALLLALSIAMRISSGFAALGFFAFFLLTKEYKILFRLIAFYALFSFIFLLPLFALNFKSIWSTLTMDYSNWPMEHSAWSKYSSLWYILKDYMLYAFVSAITVFYLFFFIPWKEIISSYRAELLLLLVSLCLIFGQIFFAPTYFEAYLNYSHIFLILFILLLAHRIILHVNNKRATFFLVAALGLFLLLYNVQWLYFIKREYTNLSLVKFGQIKKEVGPLIQKNSYGITLASAAYPLALKIKTPPDFTDTNLGFTANKNLVKKGFYNTEYLIETLNDPKIKYVILADNRWQSIIAREDKNLIPVFEAAVNKNFKVIKRLGQEYTLNKDEEEKELIFYERK